LGLEFNVIRVKFDITGRWVILAEFAAYAQYSRFNSVKGAAKPV
jgi:hypothetical protein